MELENITFLEYVNLKDKSLYNYASKFSRKLNTANDLFDIGPFTSLTFGQVKDAQHLFNDGVNWENLFKFVCQLKNTHKKHLAKNKFFELCMFRQYVAEQLNEIYNIELNLFHEVNHTDEAAGIDKLAKFGVMIQIDKLAGGDVLKYDAIKQMPYNLCFTKLLLDKETDLYNMRKNKINLEKSKPRKG